MARVVLLGAAGFTGRLIAQELAARGHRFVAAGRDETRLRTHIGQLAGVEELRTVDVTSPDQLDAVLDDAALVVTTVGPFDQLGRPVLEAAIRHGCHYVDVAAEQSFLSWAYQERDPAARAAAITAVPAAGFEAVVGDVLARVAAEAVAPGGGAPDEIHVCHLLRGGGRGLAGLSAGTRRTAAGQLGRHGVAVERGEVVEELPGEARRLAWFPKPVGPSHAVGWPGPEPITVPRHLPAVPTVRSFLAVPGWQAELFQAACSAARWKPARAALTRVLHRGPEGPSPRRRAATRWAAVAEAARQASLARAWAYGTDIYGLSAVAAVMVAEAVLAGGVPAGVVPPAALRRPQLLLDELAARSDLMWSVVRPAPVEP